MCSDDLQEIALICIIITGLLCDSYTSGGLPFWVPAGLVLTAVVAWVMSQARE